MADHTLLGKRTEFIFCHVEPVSVLREVAKFETLDQLPCLFGYESLVKDTFGARVEVAADQNYLFGLFVSRRQKFSISHAQSTLVRCSRTLASRHPADGSVNVKMFAFPHRSYSQSTR